MDLYRRMLELVSINLASKGSKHSPSGATIFILQDGPDLEDFVQGLCGLLSTHHMWWPRLNGGILVRVEDDIRFIMPRAWSVLVIEKTTSTLRCGSLDRPSPWTKRSPALKTAVRHKFVPLAILVVLRWDVLEPRSSHVVITPLSVPAAVPQLSSESTTAAVSSPEPSSSAKSSLSSAADPNPPPSTGNSSLLPSAAPKSCLPPSVALSSLPFVGKSSLPPSVDLKSSPPSSVYSSPPPFAGKSSPPRRPRLSQDCRLPQICASGNTRSLQWDVLEPRILPRATSSVGSSPRACSSVAPTPELAPGCSPLPLLVPSSPSSSPGSPSSSLVPSSTPKAQGNGAKSAMAAWNSWSAMMARNSWSAVAT